MHCSKGVASTAATKFIAHLLACPSCPADVQKGFLILRSETEKKGAMKRDAFVLAQEELEVEAFAHAENQLKQQKLGVCMKTAQVAAADKAIAEFFYSNAISFNAASHTETSLYRNMVRAIQSAPSGYVPPGQKKLAGPLLEECYQAMWRKLQARDPGGVGRVKYGATYISDGWDSCDHLPLINSAFISNNDGGTYWRSVDTSGKYKNVSSTPAPPHRLTLKALPPP